MANTPQPNDPEEQEVEKHVEEIMGPVDNRANNAFVSDEEVSKPKPEQVSEPTTAPDMPDAEKVDDEPSDNEDVPEDESVPAEESTKDEAPLRDTTENKETDKAVDDIMHDDAEATLPGGDDKAIVMKQSFWERTKNFFAGWWSNPWKRYGTLGVLVALFAVIAFVAPVRAAVLNLVGVRSSVIVHVYDGASNLPLKNAVVSSDGKSVKTDENGQAKLKDLHLGKRDIKISKVAFATATEKLNLGMRVVDIGDVTLKPIGAQLTYMLTDYLSGKPVEDAALTSGESTAKSDKDGKAIITVQPDNIKDGTITISAAGYRTDEVSPPSDLTATTHYKLVPAAHAIYVSKASGKYDVYKTYLDGKDRKILFAGTGLENQSITTLPSPSGRLVAVASTRDNKRNSDGYLLTALNIVDVASGQDTNIDYAEQISLLGWQGNTLVYSQTVAGASAANPSRQKIISYDTDSGKRYQLASANGFSGTQMVGNTLYYATSATDPKNPSNFARIKADSSGKQILLTANVWSVLRTGYDTMKLQTNSAWYDYKVSDSKPSASTPSTTYASRFYADNPAGTKSVWVDVRDNNGVLIVHDIKTGKDTELTTQKNMQVAMYWLNDSTVVYRVAGSNEVADYAINVDGGKPMKIADVSLTGIRY